MTKKKEDKKFNEGNLNYKKIKGNDKKVMTNPTMAKATNPQMKFMNNNKYNTIIIFNIKIEKTDNNKKEAPKKDIFKPFWGKMVNNKRTIFILCKGPTIEALNEKKMS